MLRMSALILTLVSLFTPNLAFSESEIRLPMPSVEQWLKPVFTTASPDLFGGRPITEGELKPSVYIGNCTATVVGPETLMTAGHCRSTGSSVSFTYERVRYTGKCVRHPQYSQGNWMNNDFAMCKFSPAINLPVWGSLKAIPMKVGDKLIMQGYGAGSNGKLNVGPSVIGRMNNMDITTSGRVTLGGGDSGGGLFAYTDDLVNGPFIIVGVNSRGDNRGNSYFNRVELERSQSFFTDYANEQGVEICGINRECNVEPGDCTRAQARVDELTLELGVAEDELEVCLAL